jgi:hypothetical protein
VKEAAGSGVRAFKVVGPALLDGRFVPDGGPYIGTWKQYRLRCGCLYITDELVGREEAVWCSVHKEAS